MQVSSEGEIGDAVDFFKKSIEAEGKQEASSGAQVCFLQTSELETGLDVARVTDEVRPDVARWLRSSVARAARTGELEEALKRCEEAAGLDTKQNLSELQSQAHKLAATYYAGKGDVDRAREYLKIAKYPDPTLGDRKVELLKTVTKERLRNLWEKTSRRSLSPPRMR